MNKIKMRTNLILQSAYQILNMVLPLITAPYISRVLGVDNVGIYSYTYTIANYFVLFAMLGVNNYGSREIARVKDNRKKLDYTFSSIFYFHAITSILALTVYIIYILSFSGQYRVYAIIQTLYVIGAFFDINWLFFGLEKFKITVTRNFIIRILTVCAVFLFVRESGHLLRYIVIMAVGTVLSQSAVWLFVSKNVSFVYVDKKKILVHLKPMLILFIAIFATSIYRQMDKIMLGKMSSMVELGCYEYADKMIMFPISLITALGTVMLPRMTNLYANGEKNEAEQILNVSINIAMWFSSALAFGMAAISEKFSVLFFGDEYLLTGVVISFLCVTIWLITFNNVIRTQYIIPKQKDSIYVWAVCFGAIINFIINIILIPQFGGVGAAIGSICAYLCVFVWQCVGVSKFIPIKRYIASAVPPALIGFAMYLIIRMLDKKMPNTWGSLIIEIIVGGGIFMVMLFFNFKRHGK